MDKLSVLFNTAQEVIAMILVLLSIFGSIAFAASGAIVAIQQKYDLFGIFILGIATSFAGGLIRNLLIGIQVTMIWHQSTLFFAAIATIIVVILTPGFWIKKGAKWITILDAIGLSTFSVQGALLANRVHATLILIVVAALFTGIGGGVLRDLLAQRQPIVFQREIYALWTILVGIVIGMHWVQPQSEWQIYSLIILTFILRMTSVKLHLKLPSIKINHSL